MIEGEWLKSSGRLSCHNCLLVWGRSVCRGRVGMVGGVIGHRRVRGCECWCESGW